MAGTKIECQGNGGTVISGYEFIIHFGRVVVISICGTRFSLH